MNYLKFRIILLLIFTCSRLLAQSHEKQEDRGQLKFLNKVHDFGTIHKDATLSAKYNFVNVGTKPVHIEMVKPDCQCTKYELSRKDLMPGDSAYIVLYLNTENKLGPQAIYSVVKADTYERMYKLTLKVDIDIPLELE